MSKAILAALIAAVLLGCAAPGARAQSADVDDMVDVLDVEEAGADAGAPEPAPEPAAEPEPELEFEPEPEPEPPVSPPAPGAAASAGAQLSYGESMLCGSFARLTASVLLHPLDTLRTRAQARKRLQPSGARFGGADIFLKGIVPQVALAMPAGALHFATLEFARDGLSRPPLQAFLRLGQPGKDLIAAAAGALAAALIRVPQEVLKQPVQAGLYPDSAAAARAVLAGGPLRLYRGFGATVLRDVPWHALGYAFFRALKLSLRAPETAKSDMLLAGLGGAIAAVLLTPLDVAKTRLMTQSSADAVQYAGALPTLLRVLREEGGRALFRGVLPRVAYLAPLAAIVYAVYEEAARLIVKLKQPRAPAEPQREPQ